MNAQTNKHESDRFGGSRTLAAGVIAGLLLLIAIQRAVVYA